MEDTWVSQRLFVGLLTFLLPQLMDGRLVGLMDIIYLGFNSLSDANKEALFWHFIKSYYYLLLTTLLI